MGLGRGLPPLPEPAAVVSAAAAQRPGRSPPQRSPGPPLRCRGEGRAAAPGPALVPPARSRRHPEPGASPLDRHCRPPPSPDRSPAGHPVPAGRHRMGAGRWPRGQPRRHRCDRIGQERRLRLPQAPAKRPVRPGAQPEQPPWCRGWGGRPRRRPARAYPRPWPGDAPARRDRPSPPGTGWPPASRAAGPAEAAATLPPAWAGRCRKPRSAGRCPGAMGQGRSPTAAAGWWMRCSRGAGQLAGCGRGLRGAASSHAIGTPAVAAAQGSQGLAEKSGSRRSRKALRPSCPSAVR